MHKMLKSSRLIMSLSALRGAVLAVVTTYLIMPLGTHAATLQICASGGDACSKFLNKYINPFILLLTALVGVGAVISIVVAGIQYSASGDDPNMIGKAKNRIFQTIIGLVAYFLLFAFLNYIVPGGLF